MKKQVGWYRESIEKFDQELSKKYPLMRDSFGDERPEHADEIISFILHAGYLNIGTTGESRDVFTGEPTGLRDNSRADDEYEWGIDLAYYVDRYNLNLPDDFVEHILAS